MPPHIRIATPIAGRDRSSTFATAPDRSSISTPRIMLKQYHIPLSVITASGIIPVKFMLMITDPTVGPPIISYTCDFLFGRMMYFAQSDGGLAEMWDTSQVMISTPLDSRGEEIARAVSPAIFDTVMSKIINPRASSSKEITTWKADAILWIAAIKSRSSKRSH